MKRVLVLVAVLLAACGWEGTGTVVDKGYDPAWSQVVCNTVNNLPHCYTVPYAESYNLRIRATDGSRHWVTVPRSTFETTDIGSPFSTGGN